MTENAATETTEGDVMTALHARAVVVRSEGLTPDERDQLFAAICDAVTALPFGADVDVTGMPFDEVADWAEDYGR